MRNYNRGDLQKPAPWVLETKKETEQMVVGTYFATAITAIASGQREKVKPKKVPTRVLYYDDKTINPSIEFPHTDVGTEAFIKEREKHWVSKNITLSKQPRDCQVEPDSNTDSGPTCPGEFPHIFESPVKTFGRNRDVRPFSRVIRNLDKPNITALQVDLSLQLYV